MAQLKQMRVSKSGKIVYGLEGVRGSLSFTKSMFAGEAPETIEIPDGVIPFAAPGSGGVGGRTPDPERVAKAEAAAQKAADRAAKALERANKLKARAAKGGATGTATASAEGSGQPQSEEAVETVEA